MALAAFPWDSAESAGDGGRISGGLHASDRAVAGLAEGFARAQPESAARIARRVEAELPLPARWFGMPARKAQLARASLLGRDGVAAELARGDVVLLDGWVVARSEAELAIYLERLARA